MFKYFWVITVGEFRDGGFVCTTYTGISQKLSAEDILADALASVGEGREKAIFYFNFWREGYNPLQIDLR